MDKHVKENNLFEFTFLRWKIVIDLNCTLSALNKRYFLNNWGKQFPEINNFEILPVEYVSRTQKILISEPGEALEIVSNLVEDVRILLKKLLRSVKTEANKEEVGTVWSGVLEYLNKSKSAEEMNDLFAGLYAACENA